MKTVITIIITSMLSIGPSHFSKEPIITFTKANINIKSSELKKVKSKTMIFNFPFKNTGNTTLILESVQTSCSCTDYKVGTKKIEPNKSSLIQLIAEVEKLESSREIYAVVVSNTAQRFNKIKVTITD